MQPTGNISWFLDRPNPLSAKFFLIDLAVANELSLSPCIQTESISQGICLPLRQFIAWFLSNYELGHFVNQINVLNSLIKNFHWKK